MDGLLAFLIAVGAWFVSLGKKVAKAWFDWRHPPYRTQVVSDNLPAHLIDHVLYVVEEDGYQEQAAMLCPCGCGRTLHMNLLPDERPCWVLTRHDDGTSTLNPSVWRQKDCRSHFWFRRGRIIWT